MSRLPPAPPRQALPFTNATRSLAALLLATGLCGWLVACSTPGGAPPARGSGPSVVPQSGPRGADGPPPGPAPDVLGVPDAEPRVEPIRSGGANKPYEVMGRAYVPLARDEPVVERGLASWYGRKFHGRRTASGETYNMLAMTAAHKTMPIPSYARVRNPANGREVIVRVNDRGPFSADRIIDLSYTAAAKLGILSGVKTVEVERITHDEIRAGLGSRAAPGGPVATTSAPTSLAALPANGPGDSRVVQPSIGAAAAAAPNTAVAAASLLPAAPPPALSTPDLSATSAVSEPSFAAALPPATQAPGPAPDRARAYTPAAVGFWLQLGAFGRGDGAYSFQQQVAQELDWLTPLLTVFADGGLHRLQAGPYSTRDQARDAADRVRSALQLVPVIVERR